MEWFNVPDNILMKIGYMETFFVIIGTTQSRNPITNIQLMFKPRFHLYICDISILRDMILIFHLDSEIFLVYFHLV